VGELIAAQDALADARPAPWRPPAGRLTTGACVVCFARGRSGPGARGDRAWAAGVALCGRAPVARCVVAGEARAPYEPGMLARREGPLLEDVVRALEVVPDVLLVDATGRDHPRRAGLALHLGAALGMPSVGVTHRPLLARGEWPDAARGATAPLVLDGELVGRWLRTRAGARPVAVHSAWRTSADVAVEVVMAASRGHRTPEPLRIARRLAREARAASGT
jgi:deoxyribonuclease V